MDCICNFKAFHVNYDVCMFYRFLGASGLLKILNHEFL